MQCVSQADIMSLLHSNNQLIEELRTDLNQTKEALFKVTEAMMAVIKKHFKDSEDSEDDGDDNNDDAVSSRLSSLSSPEPSTSGLGSTTSLSDQDRSTSSASRTFRPFGSPTNIPISRVSPIQYSPSSPVNNDNHQPTFLRRYTVGDFDTSDVELLNSDDSDNDSEPEATFDESDYDYEDAIERRSSRSTSRSSSTHSRSDRSRSPHYI